MTTLLTLWLIPYNIEGRESAINRGPAQPLRVNLIRALSKRGLTVFVFFGIQKDYF